MGAVKLDACAVRKDPRHTVDRLFADAFGPWPLLFRRTSWCGWRPVDDPYAIKQMPFSVLSKEDSEPIGARFSHNVSINETIEGLSIVVPLPQMIVESLCLEIADNVLVVSGEEATTLSAASIIENAGQTQKQFKRVIALPGKLRSGSIRAQLCGSMLRIDISREE